MSLPDQFQKLLAPPAKAAIFLVVTVRAGAEDEVRDFLAESSGLLRAVSFREPEAELSLVVGLGAQLWDRLFALPRPAHLHSFEPILGATHTAVATPGDLLFHLRATRLDLCFELAGQLMRRLDDYAEVVDEVHGFRYFDERDLLGFVDGTENPGGNAAERAVIIGAEDATHAGGSYVIVQKYLHDLDAWNRLTVEQQESAIGRHKLDDIEIPDAEKASNSHVTLNTIEDADGTQRQIVRDNMPFGAVGTKEFGTYFIGYAADPGVTEEMLRNMFIGKPPGNHDRILDFSRPVTGCLFYTPTAEFLDNPPAPADAETPAAAPPAETAAAAPAASSGDGSLGVGSLKSAEA